MQVEPYLFFEGRCEEALEFYGKALGAEVTCLMRYKDNPEPPAQDDPQAQGCKLPPNSDEKIMHAGFRIGDTTIMASDGRCSGHASFQGFSLTLAVDDDDRARTLFNALADGGQVQMPMSRTFFASSFGMVADRFGVSWMVLVEAPVTR